MVVSDSVSYFLSFPLYKYEDGWDIVPLYNGNPCTWKYGLHIERMHPTVPAATDGNLWPHQSNDCVSVFAPGTKAGYFCLLKGYHCQPGITSPSDQGKWWVFNWPYLVFQGYGISEQNYSKHYYHWDFFRDVLSFHSIYKAWNYKFLDRWIYRWTENWQTNDVDQSGQEYKGVKSDNRWFFHDYMIWLWKMVWPKNHQG